MWLSKRKVYVHVHVTKCFASTAQNSNTTMIIVHFLSSITSGLAVVQLLNHRLV